MRLFPQLPTVRLGLHVNFFLKENMTTREHLPKDFETMIDLTNGSLWLYSNKHSRKDIGHGQPEYKVYSVIPEVVKLFRKINGAKEAAVYNFRHGIAFDFIVQSFAVKSVLDILQDANLQQLGFKF